MTLRSFWTVLIKLLGIYIIIQSLIAVPYFFTSITTLYIFKGLRNQLVNMFPAVELVEGVYCILMIAIYLIIFRVCVFKTDWLIDKLQLDKGYSDERFEFNMHRSTLLKIIVILIGGYLIVDSFPLFCEQFIAYYHQQSTFSYEKFTQSPVAKYVVLYAVKIFIGYFMLTCSRRS